MTVAELGEELKKYAGYLPINDLDGLRFEANHLEIVLTDLPLADEDLLEEWERNAKDLIEEIEQYITTANWRTGKKGELRALVERIDGAIKEYKDAP